MPSFCTYCGKSFTRKEHLERHLPSHTNIKPYRCHFCHLSFARKDLLQRHTMTYHEPRDYMEPLPGVTPLVPGRTPIACQNCANAKTGCDKMVPCSRCAEKNLPCSARYARRSSKAAVRAAQAMATLRRQLDEAGQQDYLLSPQDMPEYYCQTSTALDDARALVPDNAPISSPLPVEAVALPDCPDPSPRHAFRALTFESPTEGTYRHDGLPTEDYGLGYGGFTYQKALGLPNYPLNLSSSTDDNAFAQSGLTYRPDMPLGEQHTASSLVCSSSSRNSIHTPNTGTIDFENTLQMLEQRKMSSSRSASALDFEAAVAAESTWPLARCNVSGGSNAYARTAVFYLEYLEQASINSIPMAQLEGYLEQQVWNPFESISIIPMSHRTRGSVISTTLRFLYNALDIHRGIPYISGNAYSNRSQDTNALILPPADVLEHFLRLSLRSLSYYFDSIPGGSLDPNSMVTVGEASSLLLILMLAQGASSVPMIEVGFLSTGLVETCRVALLEMNKKTEPGFNQTTLNCALLFITMGAWSGEKWLMDSAMSQRGMYMMMLKHTGMLEPRASILPNTSNHGDIESHWRAWIKRESEYRMVYGWVMVDQELGLFHDTSPVLSITDLCSPLPGPEAIWRASNAVDWLNGIQRCLDERKSAEMTLLTEEATAPSLRDLFRDLTHDTFPLKKGNLTPQQLRLLLHPLQSLVFYSRQLLLLMPPAELPYDIAVSGLGSNTQHFTEVKVLLQRWYEMAQSLRKLNQDCLVIRASLVLYHLIYLNTVTDFLRIERLARREHPEDPARERCSQHENGILQRDEAVHHCGEVFRIIALVPFDRRPPWWTAAVYRATLILWVDAMARSCHPQNKASCSPSWSSSSDRSHSLTPLMEQPQIEGFNIGAISISQSDPSNGILLPRKGGQAGSLVRLRFPAEVLDYGIQVIDDGLSTRMGEGIKRKLIALGENWSGGYAFDSYNTTLGTYS